MFFPTTDSTCDDKNDSVDVLHITLKSKKKPDETSVLHGTEVNSKPMKLKSSKGKQRICFKPTPEMSSRPTKMLKTGCSIDKRIFNLHISATRLFKDIYAMLTGFYKQDVFDFYDQFLHHDTYIESKLYEDHVLKESCTQLKQSFLNHITCMLDRMETKYGIPGLSKKLMMYVDGCQIIELSLEEGRIETRMLLHAMIALFQGILRDIDVFCLAVLKADWYVVVKNSVSILDAKINPHIGDAVKLYKRYVRYQSDTIEKNQFEINEQKKQTANTI